MQSTTDAHSDFYVKSSESADSIEFIENYEMTNDFKQLVCLPYFKNIHKVLFTLPIVRICLYVLIAL